MSLKEAPFILVDGSSYLFRAFHALPPLTNSRGEPTGALVGVVNMLRKLDHDYAPKHMAVVFDAKGPTFRHQMYAPYKANRPSMPEDLRVQIEPLHRIVEALGMPLLVVPGVEADDVIGTLARQAAALGMETLISTSDKDMAQLVGPRIRLIDTMNNTLTDEAGVIRRFGVRAEQIIDYLALVGDKVDNVPGIPGCGPKTATKWLNEYGSIDVLWENAARIKGKIGDNLRCHREQLEQARQLVTIRLDVPLAQQPDTLLRAERDIASLRDWFTRIESTRLLTTLEQEEAAPEIVPSAAESTAQYQLILQQSAFDDWIERLRQARCFAFDTETTGLDYMQAEIVGVSFAVTAGEAAYVPFAHDYPGAPQQLARDDVLGQLKALLEDPQRLKIGQNLKYDMNVLARYGITLDGIGFDTMLESYVLDSTATRHDMDSLAAKYLDHTTIKYQDVTGKGAKQITFAQVPLEQAAPYAAEDADVTLRLHQTLWPQLMRVPRLAQLLQEIEMPLLPILSLIERTGVRIDSAMLGEQSHALGERLEELEEKAHELADQAFNLGSPKQIGEIMYDKLGLPVLAKTPKGAPSTAEAVLEQLAAAGHALPAVILQHRSLAKLKSTYLDKLPLMVDANSGRVHTSYHQAVAATGRLSSSDPNLQNIPIRTEEGRRIRQAFIAEPGYRIVAADYSQIELRIMAHLSGDAGLRKAFAEKMDVHRATAAEVFGIAPEQVSNEQRRSAKAINFGLIYGMSAFGLAKQLGIERAAAQHYVERYFERYPGVKVFMERTREQARQQGYVETLDGRRLYLPDIMARNAQRRAGAERTAINAPLQGTAADIIKRAMIGVQDWLRTAESRPRMIMQVHDELVFEIREDAVTEAITQIRQRMEGAAELAVPLVVDVGCGDNWEQAH